MNNNHMFLLILYVSTYATGVSWGAELPQNYWHQPQLGSTIQGDSPLERNPRPEACAQCHQEQFNAWKGSRHALAYSPGMVGQFLDMGHQAGNDCLVCHAPLDHQRYQHNKDLVNSLSLLKQHPNGVHIQADLNSPQASLPLRHAGVTCAVCHIRDGQRFGPPRKDMDVVGKLSGSAHGGFIASKAFEQSNFCASCHQFPPSYAINGKPLENIVVEWKNSRFSRQGIQCQTCHMPDRQHLFRGIHDVDMVRSGLTFDTQKGRAWASLTISSTHIGHAFPSYVTPKVTIRATALDLNGKEVQIWHWSLNRAVFYENGWQEAKDTRLMAGESRVFMATKLNPSVIRILFQVDVIPDFYYNLNPA
ncbi:MAG: multiheme c-type cytochrome, partial [Mariprofundaceae bacterium]|nr:multiheme c-type cytochrome [Mariprofundaceae bacterium]